jgi:ABC-type multidrug transport system fused ATPase/permease subunit
VPGATHWHLGTCMLVARYYDVTSGALLIDGTDVRELDLAG